MDLTDAAACYAAVSSRDRRFDGVFFTGVHTTGIYCRPSCPARTPALRNVSFHPTAAAAQAAGFRACKRCRPEAAPGSPEWDLADHVAARAMRLVADGVVDREGIEGLADRLGYAPRHLQRLLKATLGAGPHALARAHRAQQARLLLERTDLTVAEVAYAAGFTSVRQFNDTIREVYDATPTQLRGRRGRPAAETEPAGVVRLELELPVRTPFAGRSLGRFLEAHLVEGVERFGDGWYSRTLRLPRGPATVRLHLDVDVDENGPLHHVPCIVRVTDLRDVPVAVARCRRLLDADCDPVAVDSALSQDPVLAALVARRPGLRVPGQVDPDETALRTVLGQQVTLAAGNRLAGTLADLVGEALPQALCEPGLDRLFPSAAAVAGLDPAVLPMPGARGRALVGLAQALAEGQVRLDPGVDRAETRRSLLALPGIGPWTADYIRMRALGDPDVHLAGDVAARRVMRDLGLGDGEETARAWSPWRSYALMHLWRRVLDPEPPVPVPSYSLSAERTPVPCGP